MDTATRQAIIETGDLGKRVEAYLLQGLALLDEMAPYRAVEFAKAGSAATAEAFGNANRMMEALDTLMTAIKTNGQGR